MRWDYPRLDINPVFPGCFWCSIEERALYKLHKTGITNHLLSVSVFSSLLTGRFYGNLVFIIIIIINIIIITTIIIIIIIIIIINYIGASSSFKSILFVLCNLTSSRASS